MTILPDGRWKLNPGEIKAKIWEKLHGWRVDDLSNPTHLIPNFPVCNRRSLQTICKPCGKTVAVNFWCNLKNTFVSVKYCEICVERGENEQA